MIVVAIIALLASIAVPGYLRARARGQASVILNDARILDHAIELLANEQSLANSDPVNFDAVSPYLKAAGRLVEYKGADIFGNPYVFSTVQEGVKVNATTKTTFDPEVVPSTYWGTY